MSEISPALKPEKSFDKWCCKICSFENFELLISCQMCDTKKDPIIKQSTLIKKQDLSGIICPKKTCLYQNSLLDNFCSKCGTNLIEREEELIKSSKIKKTMVSCRYCHFQNDESNKICVSCDRGMRKNIRAKSKIRAPRKPSYRYGAQICSTCGEHKILSADNMTYQCSCDLGDISTFRKKCHFCGEIIDQFTADLHDEACIERMKFFTVEQNKTYERMSELQIETMMYMHKKCEKLHYVNQNKLRMKIQKMKIKSEQLDNLHHYIVNYAPIIIHMHVNRHMEFFVKDTHYRNQFETSKSSGSLSHSSRTSWQDRMFDSKHSGASGYEKVKYGTMNFTNDPKGVRVCSGYGQSYFLLKEHVRNRCTMTDMDSSSSSATICTFKFCFHLLNKLPEGELKAAFEASKAVEVGSQVIGAYKEIQIHGPVEFSKDIQRVYISKDQLTDPKYQVMIKQFCEKNNLEYEVFQIEKPKLPAIGAIAPSIFPASSLFASSSYFAPPLFAPPPPPFSSYSIKKPPPKWEADYEQQHEQEEFQDDFDYI